MNKTITLERILEYYDVPQLFIGKDIIGTRYLCLLVDVDGVNCYITIQISLDRLGVFLSGKVDLRYIFVHPEFAGEYFIVIFENEKIILNVYNNNVLTEDMLPDEGFFYHEEQEDVSIIQEAIEQNHPVIHLGFIDANNSHSIPVNTLASLTTQYQSIVSNCFKKIDGTKNDSDFKLNVFSYSAASFNVHMYAESSLNIFGTSRIDLTLKTLDKIFRCTNKKELIEVIEPLKGHTISSYKNFIKTLIENKIVVKYKWVSSITDGEVIKNKVSIPLMEKIYEILIESSELEKEIKEFEGIMIGSNVDTGKWSFRTTDGEEVKGVTNIPALLSGVILGEMNYKIVCEEFLEFNNISAKEKSTLILVNINPLS
ncbi:hypothetical protein EZS27_022092 [termite gut metagenome]|uniref:DUF6575 domain-containing protein n=1 Tax=termite gut metagenome TaxID=433724 RepID=A0A5J4R516_9ZZZZ